MESKTCCACNLAKPMSEYYGRFGRCKACKKVSNAERWASRTEDEIEKDRKYRQDYYQTHKEQAYESNKISRQKPKNKERVKQYLKNKREITRAYYRNWYSENKIKCAEYTQKYLSKPGVRDIVNAKAQDRRNECGESYARWLIFNRSNIKPSDVPIELIEAKQTQIKISRAIKVGA